MMVITREQFCRREAVSCVSNPEWALQDSNL